MPSLLTVTAVLDLANNTGKVYKDLVRSGNALDAANEDAQGILAGLAADLVATDPAHFAALVPFITGIYGVAPGSTPVTSAFGAVAGVGPGSFGTGQGLINRSSVLSGGFFAWLEALRKDMAAYGAANSIVDLSSYAAYQNGLTAYSCLYTPDFACLFWYAYNQAQQLAPACVFAPQGIELASFAITGSGAGTFTAGLYPTTNGYTFTPGTDAYGNAVYVGGMPMPQGFAPLKNAVIVNTGSTTIAAGTTITVTAPNQAGVSKTWITTIAAGGLAAAASTAVTVGAGTAASTDRIWGTPTAIAITGGAAGQSFQVQSGATERAY